MDNLEPITRNEMFLNGDDLEPITREEMILAGADLEPITRHEWFLKRYRGGGGGGGYDLVNVPNLPADIASFNDGTDLPMASLKVTVTPYQDLSHGDPSPENICPISGWDEVNVTVADDVDNPTVSQTYTINLGGTRYGGVVDATNGTMTVDRAMVDLGTLTPYMLTTGIFAFHVLTPTNGKILCSAYKTVNVVNPSNLGDKEITTTPHIGTYYPVVVKDLDYSDATSFKQAVNGVQLCYELATPITVQLAPQPVKSLEGENNISANCGQITEVKYFKKA